MEHHGFKHLYIQQNAAGEQIRSNSRDTNSEDISVAVAKLGVSSPPPSAGSHSPASQSFARPQDLLDFVTKQWQGRFVMTDIATEAIFEVFARRPFFLLLSTDAPLTVRWQRFQDRARIRGEPSLDLAEFAERNDEQLYDPSAGLQSLISKATIRLLNTSSSLAHLYATLGKLDIPNHDRLRPGWDTYFMALAALAAQRSNCMKRRVGCVLVGQGRRVVSTGYNGTPRGLRNCAEGGCPRCNDGNSSGVGLATCLCLHAEENALLEAGRDRIRDGSVLYCDTCPCLTCSIKICQVGITEVVYAHGYSMDTETAAVFREAGVKLRQFTPVRHFRCFFCLDLLTY